MPTLPAYERDPFATSLETRILRVGEETGRPFAILEDTVFYPEGGGQPCDLGTLNGAAVVDVQKRDGEIRHYLDSVQEAGPASLRLDWTRRFDHMQQHTGQHLLTAVAQDQFKWETTAFHLGASVCDIELDAPSVSPAEMARLEEAVAAEIRARREVTARWVSAEAYGREAVRSRGLPEGHSGDIRLVQIAGVDLNTCGGTHLRHTGEIEVLKLLGTESIRGGTRLFYVAGRRARLRLGAHEQRNAGLRALLGAPDEELVAALQIKLDQLLALERRSRKLEEDLAEYQAAALAAQPGVFAEVHVEGRDMAFLQKLARGILAIDPAKAVFVTADLGGQGIFLLSAGEGSALDVPAAGKAVAAILGAKGGGSGKSFQGKASTLAAREQAVALLREMGQ
ncbi:MAG: alanyl-tRNA editing protein [Geothrix sp.]|uniref:alanyl-tRNA editing protein n=1 Tax=Geothrix sp. TaxID=1962974 RepID=UPI0017C73B1A|nr:alanyl-tRNA editing protein [Geothrix sp.]NWJ39672.1 alanyl-tRNA editing protein [Geothrix sp.]WIL22308.1 MAG: alanyl-tRNA editing protein [Geothrix sp.]